MLLLCAVLKPASMRDLPLSGYVEMPGPFRAAFCEHHHLQTHLTLSVAGIRMAVAQWSG